MFKKFLKFGSFLLNYVPFVLILLFLWVVPAHAQNGDGIGNVLVDLVNQLGATITTVILAGFAEVTRLLTGWVRTWSVFTEEERSKIAGLGAGVLNAVSSLVVALLAIGLGQLTGVVSNLDSTQFLQLLGVLTGANFGGSAALLHKLHKAVK